MDFQQIISNFADASRAKEMLLSDQLTLGELILKLKAVTNQTLPVFFDKTENRPTGLGSWRGNYAELAIQYDGGADDCYEPPKSDCEIGEFGIHSPKCHCGGLSKFKTRLPSNVTVAGIVKMLEFIKGKMFVGYKGGDFIMGKTTPMWVANHGTSSGFIGHYQMIVEVKETKKKAVLITAIGD